MQTPNSPFTTSTILGTGSGATIISLCGQDNMHNMIIAEVQLWREVIPTITKEQSSWLKNYFLFVSFHHFHGYNYIFYRAFFKIFFLFFSAASSETCMQQLNSKAVLTFSGGSPPLLISAGN